MHKKKLILLWVGVLGVIGGCYGQTTYSWRNDQNPPANANWENGSPIYWWNGSTAVMPSGAEILSFDGFSTNLISVNNLSATNRYRITFENTNSPGSRILNGTTTNTFFDFSDNQPGIINNSNVTHTINFPFLNGNSKGANRLNINAANGDLNIGSTIAASGGLRNLVAMGGNNITFSGIISNGSGLNFIKEGSGTTILSGNNTYSGITTITAGILNLQHSNALGTATGITDNGTIISSGAVLELQDGISVGNEMLTIGGSGISNGGALRNILYNNSWAGNITLSSATRINAVNGSLTLSGNIITSSYGLTLGGSGNLIISGVISGTSSLTKEGIGGLILSGINTYTGNTIVTNSLGELELGATEVIANVSNLQLNGGTFKTGIKLGPGFSETLGRLILNESSSIGLGTGNHTLTFANSSSISWAANKILTIAGWSGNACQSGTGGRIYVGVGGLTSTQLAQIKFSGYPVPGARILADGELVPVGVGVITGNTNIFGGENNVAYSVPFVTDATNYTWTVPTGATIDGAINFRNILLDYLCSAQSGNITVTANGGSCNGFTSTVAVATNNIGSVKPIISGPDIIIEGSTFNYIVTNASAILNEQYYNWTGPGPSNALTGGSNSVFLGIACDLPSGSIKVTPSNSNGCLGTPSDNFTVTIGQVGAAGAFQTTNNYSPSTVCKDSTYEYRIPEVTNASILSWEVPTGSTFTQSHPGARNILVTWGSTSGNVTVTPKSENGQCTGTSRSYYVTVYTASPTTPTLITQAMPSGNIVCPGASGVTYEITEVANATSYAWTVPTGASIISGAGTTKITVNWGTAISGNITVRAVNPCGASSDPSILLVTVANIPAPLASSPQSFCTGATVANLTATGTSIQWYAAASGGTALASTTILVDGNTYYVSETVSGCESYRAPVVVNLNATGNWTGTTNTDWHTGSNWCDGAVPGVGTDVVIPAGAPLYPIISGADAAAASISIASGASLEMSSAQTLAISNNGYLTNNGIFTSGNGTIEFLGVGNIAGTATIFNNVIIRGAVNFGTGLSTIDGTLTINNGGFINTNGPSYTANSKLLYNTGSTYARGLEWSHAANPNLGTTAGYPNDIQISNSTTLDYPNNAGANTTILSIARDLSIDAGSSLYLDYGAGISSGALTIGRHIALAGNLSLGDGAGANLNVRGNFTKTSGTWNGNGRELIFNGTGSQSFSSNDNITIQTLRNNNSSINPLSINSSLIIGSGGGAFFNVTDSRTTVAAGVTITFTDGTTIATINGVTTVNGTLLSQGTTGISTAAQTSFASLKFSSTGIFNHNATRSGISSLGPVPIAEWQTGSLCTVTGLTSPNAGLWPSEGMGQNFANFTWNTPLMTTSPIVGVNLNVSGTLTISSTGSSEIRLASGANRSINTANYNHSGGTLNLAQGALTGTLNVSSNFMFSGGTIQTSGGSTTSGVNYNGSSNQSISFSGGMITGLVNFSFNNNAGYNLTGTLPINNNAAARVNAGLFSGTGELSYGSTNTLLAYGGTSAYTSSNYEFPATNGPVNLRINNGAGISIHAARSLPASGILTLTNGIITTTPTNLLTITNTAAGAISGGSVLSYINGPLDRWVSTATVYIFPVGDATYLPVDISSVAGTSPVLSIQAFNASSGGSYDGSLSGVSNSEYWAASLTSGTLTNATIGLTRQIPVGTNSSIARSSSNNGLYSSIGGNAAGNTISNGITNGVLGIFVMGVGNGVYYWTNNATMNWETASDWLMTNGPTLTNPAIPAVSPNAGNSNGITLQTGHTITISSDVIIDQTIIQSGATLVNGAGSLSINDGVGTDLDIYGTFRHNSSITASINGQGIIRTNGILEVTNNSPGASSYGTSSNLTYENASTFFWNDNTGAIFATDGTTYFPNSPDGIIPVFRINTPNIVVGAVANTTINGLFQVDANTIDFQNEGIKTFRNGITGAGNVVQSADCGQFIINGTTSELGGSGTITLNTNGLRLSNGTCTLLSNKPFNSTSGSGIFTVGSGATLNAQIYSLTGTGLYTQEAAGTLETANETGVNGSITVSGNQDFVSGANYTFNGTVTQTTGTQMGNVIGTLTINNPGTVILTNNTHTTATLNLTNGLFNIGTGQNLNISSGGSVNATAGDFVSGINAGTIFFNSIGGGSFSGNSNPYNVRIQGPVNFGTGTVTIQNGGTLRIDQFGGITSNGPFYASGSTLQYSSGGYFERFLEWNAGSGRGNPHHVLLSNGTILSPARSDLIYAATPFIANGNLTIQSGNSLYMDYGGQNMTQPLQIGGDLFLEGNLSASGEPGGDIKLAGNWTRASTGTFFPNNRAVFFTGNGTQVITNTSASAVDRIEIFPYFIIDKTAGDVQLSGSPNTTNVLVNGASGHVLDILNGNIDLNGNLFELGGAGGDFRVDGATQKRIHSATAAIFRVVGNKNITGTNAGNLLFDDRVIVEIAAGLNFGSNNLNIHVTTINATLQINPGGYADVYAPYYGPNGILVYNTGGPDYLRRVEWRGEAGEPGYPNDVIIQANTNLYAGGPNSGESVNNALSARRDVTIEAGSSLNMSGIYNMNRNLIVGRDLTINGNLTGSNIPDVDVFVGRNWTRGSSGIFTNLNNCAVFFNTNEPATISNAGGIETFPYVIVDKAGSPDNTLTLAAPVNISNKFTLSSGRVVTNPINVLSITNPLTDDVANGVGFVDGNPGYVDGPMRRNVQNTSGENCYTFPVGTLSGGAHFIKRLRLRDVSESATPNYFSASYHRAAPPLGSATNYFFQDILLGIRIDEYWDVEREVGSLAKGRLVLPYTDPGPLGWLLATGTATSPPNDANVAVVKGDGSGNYYFTEPTNNSFSNYGTEPQASHYAINGDLQSRLIETFSPFTFGYGYNGILPIKLLTFSATLHIGDGLLQWKIADAKDLRQFEVEHSIDGQRFNRIGTVMPDGGLSYSYLHKNLAAGLHYYRLRMVEKDGQASLSKTEIIQVGRQQTYITGLLQNPVVGGQAIVQVNSAIPQHAEAVVLDAIGRMLLRQKVQLMAGPNNVNLTVLPLPAGTYRILFRTQDGVEKVMPMMK